MNADSSAAIAITDRQGAGKLRHINVSLLWVQEKSKGKEIDFVKVKGELNPADLMTKGLSWDKACGHGRRMGLDFREGRADQGIEVQRHGAIQVEGRILAMEAMLGAVKSVRFNDR